MPAHFTSLDDHTHSFSADVYKTELAVRSMILTPHTRLTVTLYL